MSFLAPDWLPVIDITPAGAATATRIVWSDATDAYVMAATPKGRLDAVRTVCEGCGCAAMLVPPVGATFTTPTANGMPWIDGARAVTSEFLGARILPGTEIGVTQPLQQINGTDYNTGTLACGKATLTATIEIAGTTQAGVRFGAAWLRKQLTGGTCTCGACNPMTVSLYSYCDAAAAAGPAGTNAGRRTLRKCRLTEWTEEESEIDGCYGRVIGVTIEAEDPRLWLASQAVASAAPASGAPFASLGCTTFLVPSPGAWSTNNYTWTESRCTRPIELKPDGTFCPVGSWPMSDLIQAGGACNPTIVSYGTDTCKRPVRLVYDRLAVPTPTLNFEPVGWGGVTGAGIPCDLYPLLEITEIRYRDTTAGNPFVTAAAPSGDCCYYVNLGTFSSQFLGGAAAIAPVPGSLLWDPAWNGGNLQLGCKFIPWIPACPSCPPTVNRTIVLNTGAQTWSTSGWTYNGGPLPPAGVSLVISGTGGSNVSKTSILTTKGAICAIDPACTPPPAIRPAAALGLCAQLNAGTQACMRTVTLPVIPTERCGTITLTIPGVLDVINAWRVAIWDTTGLAVTPAALWARDPVAIGDLTTIAAGNTLSVDSRDGIVATVCAAGTFPDEGLLAGLDGLWNHPTLAGGRTYTLAFVSALATPAAFPTVTVTLETWETV